MTKLTDEWVDKEILLAQESSSPYTHFNRQNNPSAFDAVKGTDADKVEVGKDPEEVFEQLELPLDLAGGPYRDNKEGNVDEVWDLTGDKLIGPMPKSFYDTTDKLKKKIPPIDLVELNPDQIEALKQIPANIKDLPDEERLKIMRKVTKTVKGLA